MSIEALPQGEAHAALVCAGLERFFGRIDQEALNALAARMEVRPLMRGQTLYRQGDDGNALHVLLTGRLQVVVRADDGTDRVLAYPSPGDTVGEMALFTGARRTAGVLAMRDSMVAELRRRTGRPGAAACPADRNGGFSCRGCFPPSGPGRRQSPLRRPFFPQQASP